MATQARVGTLHFYLPTPTREYWGDLQSLGARLRAGARSVRRRRRREPAAARLGRGRTRFHGAARQLRSGASVRRDRRLRRSRERDRTTLAEGGLRDSLLQRLQARPVPSPQDAVRRRRATKSIATIPACRSTPATRACAKCRCCTTSCARCSKTALRSAAAAARDRGAGAGHRSLRAVPRRGVRRPWRGTPDCHPVGAGRRQPAGRRTAGRRVPAPAGVAGVALRPGRNRSTCSPARRWPRPPASMPPRSSACTAGCTRPARAGASMPRIARATARRATSLHLAVRARPPAARPRQRRRRRHRRQSSRRGRNSKAARSTRSTRCCGCCACSRATSACWAKRCRRRAGANACSDCSMRCCRDRRRRQRRSARWTACAR